MGWEDPSRSAIRLLWKGSYSLRFWYTSSLWFAVSSSIFQVHWYLAVELLKRFLYLQSGYYHSCWLWMSSVEPLPGVQNMKSKLCLEKGVHGAALGILFLEEAEGSWTNVLWFGVHNTPGPAHAMSGFHGSHGQLFPSVPYFLPPISIYTSKTQETFLLLYWYFC